MSCEVEAQDEDQNHRREPTCGENGPWDVVPTDRVERLASILGMFGKGTSRASCEGLGCKRVWKKGQKMMKGSNVNEGHTWVGTSLSSIEALRNYQLHSRSSRLHW